MKNEQEVNILPKQKAMFVAQYLYQDVIVYGDSDKPRTVNSLDISYSTADYYLLLRAVEQLTDDEVILCGQIGFDFFNCIGVDHKLKVVRELSKISLAMISIDEKACLAKIEISNEWKLNIAQIDYLRSIGMLIPFTYLDENNKPQTLQPDEIIAKGWAKIQTP